METLPKNRKHLKGYFAEYLPQFVSWDFYRNRRNLVLTKVNKIKKCKLKIICTFIHFYSEAIQEITVIFMEYFSLKFTPIYPCLLLFTPLADSAWDNYAAFKVLFIEFNVWLEYAIKNIWKLFVLHNCFNNFLIASSKCS